MFTSTMKTKNRPLKFWYHKRNKNKKIRLKCIPSNVLSYGRLNFFSVGEFRSFFSFYLFLVLRSGTVCKMVDVMLCSRYIFNHYKILVTLACPMGVCLIHTEYYIESHRLSTQCRKTSDGGFQHVISSGSRTTIRLCEWGRCEK